MNPIARKLKSGTMVLLVSAPGLLSGHLSAQNHIALSYDYSISLAQTRDYIRTGSFRGGSFEFSHHLTDMIAVGLKVGLHTFYEDLEKDTYTEGTITVYGKQFRYLNSFPVLGTFQYYLMPLESRVNPYLKVGTGGYYFQKRTDLGLYTFVNEYQWNFGIQPEAGLLISISRNLAGDIGVRYNYVFGNRSIDRQQYLNLSAGILFRNLGRR